MWEGGENKMNPVQVAQVIPAATLPAVTDTAAKVMLDWGTAFGTLQMKVIAILLVADIILGIAAALAEKKFVFSMLATFMSNGVIPFLLGFAVVELVAQAFPVYGEVATFIVFVAIVANIVASIIANLATFGVNMPAVLKKKVV